MLRRQCFCGWQANGGQPLLRIAGYYPYFLWSEKRHKHFRLNSTGLRTHPPRIFDSPVGLQNVRTFGHSIACFQ
jgi:hypothetical protein